MEQNQNNENNKPTNITSTTNESKLDKISNLLSDYKDYADIGNALNSMMSSERECPYCHSKDVTKIKNTTPTEALKNSVGAATAGGALATAIPIPAISTGLGALAGGIAGIIHEGQDIYQTARKTSSKLCLVEDG